MDNNIDQLILDHRKLIESEASKYAKFIPLTLAQVEAYKLAREAAARYDRSTGLKFSTYLTNYLQKLSRLSTQYGGAVRVPENKQFKINKLNQIETGLQEDLRRAPTVSELADASGQSVQTVHNLLKARKKEVNLNNLMYTPIFFEGNEDDWVHFVYHDLSPKDKLIFEHKIGFGGKEKLDNNEIAKRLSVSPSTISQRVKLITDKLKQGFQ